MQNVGKHSNETLLSPSTTEYTSKQRPYLPPGPPAMNILKIATLNINGIHTTTRIAMLQDFLKCHAILTRGHPPTTLTICRDKQHKQMSEQ